MPFQFNPHRLQISAEESLRRGLRAMPGSETDGPAENNGLYKLAMASWSDPKALSVLLWLIYYTMTGPKTDKKTLEAANTIISAIRKRIQDELHAAVEH